MTILDANVWIAFLHKTDTLHKKAEKVFQTQKEQIILTEYVTYYLKIKQVSLDRLFSLRSRYLKDL